MQSINEISARWKTLPTHRGTLPTHWGTLSTHWEIISTRWKHSPTHLKTLQRVFNAFLNAFSTHFRLISYAGFSQIGSHMLLNGNFSGHLPVQLVLNEILRHPLGTFRKTLSRVFCIIPDRIVLTCDKRDLKLSEKTHPLYPKYRDPPKNFRFIRIFDQLYEISFRLTRNRFEISGMHSNFRVAFEIRSNFRPKKSRNFARNIDEFSVEQ